MTCCWRASTCCLGCLYSSCVLCLYIDFSPILNPPACAPFYDKWYYSQCLRVTSPIPVCASLAHVDLLLLLLSLLFPSLCYLVLCVLWRRRSDSKHSVSTTRSPGSRLPATPEAANFQGLQHTLLPRSSPNFRTAPKQSSSRTSSKR